MQFLDVAKAWSANAGAAVSKVAALSKAGSKKCFMVVLTGWVTFNQRNCTVRG
jgi:hypothetical protein